ncbi:MAG: DUF4180 domain-containing protein [Spirochaetales bacterium]|nr:DUF4180 domain-containing protein [Spirochaetales bacterium]
MEKTVQYYESTEMIKDTGDFLDLIGNAGYRGASGILIHSIHLPDAFFELKSGLAGEYLQKLSNYSVRAAIVLEDSHLNHPRFREMVREANKGGNIAYFTYAEAAGEWLDK